MFGGVLLIAIGVVVWVLLFAGPASDGLPSAEPANATLFAGTSSFDASPQAINPLPQTLSLDAKKVALGRLLFEDKRLSHDNSIACAGCHDLARAGVDHRPTAIGIGGQRGDVNAPTVYNSAFNFRQFWDGRAADLEEQAGGPVHNPIEMASNWQEVIGKLNADSTYPRLFKESYGGISPYAIQNAIATFETSLFTPDSPFDRHLRGDVKALSPEAAAGWKLFRQLGCIACHQGVNLGGNMYAGLGVMGDYFKDRGRPLTKADMGRYNVTGREEDRHVFKVPSLRNVAQTGPYFHDGSVATLEQAVDLMARYQLGVELDAVSRQRLASFLMSLSGVFPPLTPTGAAP
ncbi:MAG: cytochrome-c peroxidase [Rhodocyclaceae bacterium]|nr:cytochrome-c peroxidase [Rhodocyclaceae bacterium]